MLNYLLFASNRSSFSAFSGLKDAESDHMIANQPKPQTAGSPASHQQPEEGATNPKYTLVSKPGSLLKTQHQENNVSATAPLHVVAFPMPYSSSVDMFCQMHPNDLSNMDYPMAPVLVPLTYTGLNPSQIAASHAQRPNCASLDAKILPANTPGLLGPNPVCTSTPASCLPVFSILSAQGLHSSRGSDSLFIQNKTPEAPSDPVSVHRAAALDCMVTEPPSFPLPTAERYIVL